jgi:hypothetical protein
MGISEVMSDAGILYYPEPPMIETNNGLIEIRGM